MRVLVIGLSRDLPLGPADAMELADHLVKRAAGVQSDGEIILVEKNVHLRILHLRLIYCVKCQTVQKNAALMGPNTDKQTRPKALRV